MDHPRETGTWWVYSALSAGVLPILGISIKWIYAQHPEPLTKGAKGTIFATESLLPTAATGVSFSHLLHIV